MLATVVNDQLAKQQAATGTAATSNGAGLRTTQDAGAGGGGDNKFWGEIHHCRHEWAEEPRAGQEYTKRWGTMTTETLRTN